MYFHFGINWPQVGQMSKQSTIAPQSMQDSAKERVMLIINYNMLSDTRTVIDKDFLAQIIDTDRLIIGKFPVLFDHKTKKFHKFLNLKAVISNKNFEQRQKLDQKILSCVKVINQHYCNLIVDYRYHKKKFVLEYIMDQVDGANLYHPKLQNDKSINSKFCEFVVHNASQTFPYCHLDPTASNVMYKNNTFKFIDFDEIIENYLNEKTLSLDDVKKVYEYKLMNFLSTEQFDILWTRYFSKRN
jgi:tRNA A-37 threonylcarbamoyl transferase component Bud32